MSIQTNSGLKSTCYMNRQLNEQENGEKLAIHLKIKSLLKFCWIISVQRWNLSVVFFWVFQSSCSDHGVFICCERKMLLQSNLFIETILKSAIMKVAIYFLGSLMQVLIVQLNLCQRPPVLRDHLLFKIIYPPRGMVSIKRFIILCLIRLLSPILLL